jgi:serine/threonine-protein kinase
MPVCPTCNTTLDANARFCPKDGTTIRADSVLIPVGPGAGDLGRAATVTVRSRKKLQRAVTDPAVDPLIGKVLDGRYKIRARLGEGGVGAVYEGEHIQIKKTVAIKVLHAIYATTEEFRRRFEREARAASRLSHPGCVLVLDFGKVEKVAPHIEGDAHRLLGMPYLVMEFCRGTLLLDRLIEGSAGGSLPPIPPTEAVQIARDILQALRHAHGLGIVHRDLKPANIMLTEGDTTTTICKLLDFGLAKELDADSKDLPLTQAGMVFGTPGYLSPEQAAGKQVDARTDLYSTAVVLFEMVCNRRLFDRDDPIDAVRDHLHTPPPDPRTLNPDVSPELAAAILKGLEKDPERRWPTAEAFAEGLRQVPELGWSPRAPSRWTMLERRLLGRPMWQWGAGAIVLLAAVIGIAVAASGGKRPAPPPPIAPMPVAKPATKISDGAKFAFDLLRDDRIEDAVGAARTAIRDNPHDGAAHEALAVAYARKLWCSDAVEELDRALRDDPRLANEPEVARRAVQCLGPKTNAKATRFLTERIGAAGRAQIEAAIAAEPNAELKRAGQKVLERLQ